jgi:hypothetical protein
MLQCSNTRRKEGDGCLGVVHGCAVLVWCPMWAEFGIQDAHSSHGDTCFRTHRMSQQRIEVAQYKGLVS